MNQQLSLMGFEPPKLAHRLFFAIFADADTAPRLTRLAHRLRDEQGLQGRPLDAERFHVTLHHLGDHVELAEDTVALAIKAAARIETAAFEMAFDRVMSFAGRRGNQPVVLSADAGVAALVEFQQRLGGALRDVGLGKHVEKQFTPHVTLLYDDRRVVEQAVQPIGWRAREFVLVDSLLRKHVHVPLGRWQLRDPAQAPALSSL